MKNFFIALALAQLLILEAFSFRIIDKHFQMAKQQSEAIQKKLNSFSIGELRNLILLVEIYKLRKQQEEERHIEEVNMKKMMDEWKRQRIIQTYLGSRVGTKSILKDFYPNRI